MDVFPAFLPLAGRKIVIVGAGELAEGKARLFEGSPAEVVRMAEGPAALEPAAYAGVLIAFIATEDAAFAEAAVAVARAAGALVNAVDRPALSDFTMPAIVDRGVVVAGIGTGGASPVLATRLRQELEARWPEGLGRLADLSRRIQAEARARWPDLAQRRAVLRRMLSGPAAQAALAGDLGRAETLAREELAADKPAPGVVRFLTAPDDPDLLTLRALRALAEADRIAADPDASPAVLALARRDASLGGPASPETLADWAREGLAVVVATRVRDPALIEAVRALGVETELLRVARP